MQTDPHKLCALPERQTCHFTQQAQDWRTANRSRRGAYSVLHRPRHQGRGVPTAKRQKHALLATPSHAPGLFGSLLEEGGFILCPGFCQMSNEAHSHLRPSARHLTCEHHQSGPATGENQHWVSALFPLPYSDQNSPVLVYSSSARRLVTMQ